MPPLPPGSRWQGLRSENRGRAALPCESGQVAVLLPNNSAGGGGIEHFDKQLTKLLHLKYTAREHCEARQGSRSQISASSAILAATTAGGSSATTDGGSSGGMRRWRRRQRRGVAALLQAALGGQAVPMNTKDPTVAVIAAEARTCSLFASLQTPGSHACYSAVKVEVSCAAKQQQERETRSFLLRTLSLLAASRSPRSRLDKAAAAHPTPIYSPISP